MIVSCVAEVELEKLEVGREEAKQMRESDQPSGTFKLIVRRGRSGRCGEMKRTYF